MLVYAWMEFFSCNTAVPTYSEIYHEIKEDINYVHTLLLVAAQNDGWNAKEGSLMEPQRQECYACKCFLFYDHKKFVFCSICVT